MVLYCIVELQIQERHRVTRRHETWILWWTSKYDDEKNKLSAWVLWDPVMWMFSFLHHLKQFLCQIPDILSNETFIAWVNMLETGWYWHDMLGAFWQHGYFTCSYHFFCFSSFSSIEIKGHAGNIIIYFSLLFSGAPFSYGVFLLVQFSCSN